MADFSTPPHKSKLYIDGVLSGYPQEFERIVSMPGADDIVLAFRYIPDKDEQGKIRGFFVLGTDISILKQSEHRMMIANNTLTQVSRTDGLTGAINRMYFDELLETEWLRGSRSNTAIGALMIDIDYFKQYNDAYGHPAGDECIKIVVEAISGIVRDPPDVFARYGGEEFVCLLPGANIESTATVGERILAAIHDRNLPHTHSSVAEHVTVSIGGASLVPAPNQPCGALIESADQNLYRAKHGGRNRLVAD